MRTKALVIREYTVGESDKYITLFTKEVGKIEVLAPRAKKTDRGFASGTQLFVYGEFMLTSFKDTYRLVGVEVIEMFHKIREDLDVLCYASYIMEFIQSVTEPNMQQTDLLKHTLMTLKALAKGTMDLKLVRRIFEIRAMSIIGFMPQLMACTSCGEVVAEEEHESYGFCVSEGGLVCKSCRLGGKLIKISYSTLYTMRYIIMAPFKTLFHFEVSKSVQKELDEVCNQYIPYYIDKNFKTLEFIERMEVFS